LRCMAIDADDRYQSMDEVIEALEHVRLAPRTAVAALPVGTVLDDSYRITGIIGQGGMGTVYEAEHTRLPQHLAIKVISGVVDAEAIARFRREAEIASGLGHANIIRVFDFNTLPDGTPYMVMEYLDGEDLSAVLDRGPVDVARALSIARQTGSALAAAHAGGIVHRDLKPSNIFLSMREVGGEVIEHVTILDFGVSKIQDSHTVSTETQALVGTPQYMAPEQAMGENDRLDARSDEFALACVVYEMLTGEPAFAGGRLAEVVYRVCHSDPTPLDVLVPTLEREVVFAIRRGLAKSPADRFTDVPAFIAALTGRPLEALPRSRKPRTTTPRSESSAAQRATKREGSGARQQAKAPANPSETSTPLPTGFSDTPAAKSERGAELVTPAPAPARSVTARDSIPTAPQVPAAKPPPDLDRSEPVPSAQPNASGLGRWLIGGGFAVVVVTFVGALVVGARHPRFANRELGPSSPAHSTETRATSTDTDELTPAHPLANPTGKTDEPGTGPTPDSKNDDPETNEPEAKRPPGSDGTDSPGPGHRNETDENKSPSSKRPSTETIAPAARADLDAAAAKLAQNDFAAAQRLARRSFQSQETSRGFAIMVKSYCGEGNLGAARDYLARVSSKSERSRAIRYCADHGIDIRD